MLSPQQLAQRRLGVTATDLAAITGRHPWKRPIDVWREKVIGGTAAELGPRGAWGNELEPPVRSWYSKELGVEVAESGTLQHPSDPLLLATPDGIAYRPRDPRPLNGLEIKSHAFTFAHYYGPPGTDEVPDWELFQCAGGMAVTGLPTWHLVPVIDGEPRIYVIQRNAELEGLLAVAAHEFWDRYVVTRKEPPVDGSSSYSAHLNRRFPRHGGPLKQATPEQQDLIRRLRAARAARAAAEELEATLAQEIQEQIGDAEGLSWREGAREEKVTWRRSRDGVAVDWQAVARARSNALEMLQTAAIGAGLIDGDVTTLDEEIQRHSAIAPGSRRFCVPRSW